MKKKSKLVNRPNQAKMFIASDHAGFALKEALKEHFEVFDLGTNSEERCDYPDFAKKAVKLLKQKKFEKGILVCGSGIGMAMAANRFKGIRAVVADCERTARLSRLHNDSNILCLGGRTLATAYAVDIINTWLTTSFEGGRHASRVKKMDRG